MTGDEERIRRTRLTLRELGCKTNHLVQLTAAIVRHNDVLAAAMGEVEMYEAEAEDRRRRPSANPKAKAARKRVEKTQKKLNKVQKKQVVAQDRVRELTEGLIGEEEILVRNERDFNVLAKLIAQGFHGRVVIDHNSNEAAILVTRMQNTNLLYRFI